jgi:2-polyprenyl-6-methoxyphenol hydroxylase-like FAD-dependent oxidoreductase
LLLFLLIVFGVVADGAGSCLNFDCTFAAIAGRVEAKANLCHAGPMRQPSIFIAGGGPVGLTAAIELKRRGFEPRIVDPDATASPESRALAVNSRTLDLMEPSGVTDALLAAGNRVKRVVIRRGVNIITEIDLSRIPHRFNFLLVVAQSQTEAILTRRLNDMGVELERSTGLEKLVPGVPNELSLSDGTQTSADILIGADGAHSVTRKSLGLDFTGETQAEVFGLADVELADWPFPFDTMVLTVLDTHLAPFVPMAEGFGRFISTRGQCLNSLPQDAKVKRVAWETDFRISYRQVEAYQKGNVFLAGDAAHIHSPVGGRGMNLGMEDACWLAWLIEQGRASEYSALRHPVGADVLRYTYRFTQFAKARGNLQDLALRVGLPLVTGIAPLRNRFFNMLTALDTPSAPWL